MDLVIRSDSDHVATLTLNRPAALNALSADLIAALRTALMDLAEDPAIRVIILTGAGRGFCAGHDLKDMQAARQAPDGGRAAFDALFAACSELMLAVQNQPQPIIAQVHGIAAAAGCQLVAACDLAVAAQDARFAVNGVNIGLFCSTPMVALSRNLPRKQAFELLTTGAFLSAADAKTYGLINRTAPAAELEAATQTLASTIAGKLSAAVKLGKRAFYDQLEMPVADAYAFTRNVIAENMMMADTQEGIQAFLEKRPPDWAE